MVRAQAKEALSGVGAEGAVGISWAAAICSASIAIPPPLATPSPVALPALLFPTAVVRGFEAVVNSVEGFRRILAAHLRPDQRGGSHDRILHHALPPNRITVGTGRIFVGGEAPLPAVLTVTGQ